MRPNKSNKKSDRKNKNGSPNTRIKNNSFSKTNRKLSRIRRTKEQKVEKV